MFCGPVLLSPSSFFVLFAVFLSFSAEECSVLYALAPYTRKRSRRGGIRETRRTYLSHQLSAGVSTSLSGSLTAKAAPRYEKRRISITSIANTQKFPGRKWRRR